MIFNDHASNHNSANQLTILKVSDTTCNEDKMSWKNFKQNQGSGSCIWALLLNLINSNPPPPPPLPAERQEYLQCWFLTAQNQKPLDVFQQLQFAVSLMSTKNKYEYTYMQYTQWIIINFKIVNEVIITWISNTDIIYTIKWSVVRAIERLRVHFS